MEGLRTFILQFVQPNEAEMAALFGIVKKVDFAKGKKIIQVGAVNNRIYFVNKGVLKYSALNQDNKIKAISIAMENDLVSDYFSYFSGLPSISAIETLSECDLLFVHREDLNLLYETFKVWEKFGRLVAEAAMMEQIIAKLDFQTKSPEQRYLELIKKKTNILSEVNLGVIAECLGITQETLSRIRARI
jgi:CRP-like cAMP-binding protein